MTAPAPPVVEHNRPVGSWQRRYLDRFYDRRKGWVDGTQNFFDVVERHVSEGTLYVAAVLDLYARRFVGWSASSSMHRTLAIDALTKAIFDRRPSAGLVHHSDQGSQYTSDDYRAVLDAHGAIASYSGRGQCLDNAVAESFFSTLKAELVHRERFESHEAAIEAVGRYIDVFYNHRRRHTRLGYRTPAEHEAKYHQGVATAT